MNRFQKTAPVALGLLGSVTGGVDVHAAVVEWQGNIVIPANIDGLYIKVDPNKPWLGWGLVFRVGTSIHTVPRR